MFVRLHCFKQLPDLEGGHARPPEIRDFLPSFSPASPCTCLGNPPLVRGQKCKWGRAVCPFPRACFQLEAESERKEERCFIFKSESLALKSNFWLFWDHVTFFPKTYLKGHEFALVLSQKHGISKTLWHLKMLWKQS